MFEKILKYLQINFTINEADLIELEKYIQSLDKSTSKLEAKMKLVGEKYKFETLGNLKTQFPFVTTNTLFFWRELSDFTMSIALDDEEMDKEFMLFINENDIYDPCFDKADLQNVCYDIYHCWVGFVFQKLKLYENGIPMGITVNSDVVSYYFNDFSYNNYSNYHELYDTDKLVSRPFDRDLTFEEIFIRTHFIQFPYRKIKLISKNQNYIETGELENSKFKFSKFDLESKKCIESQEKQLALGSSYDRNEGFDIDYLIKYFESTINRGMKFDLNESKFEK